MRVGVCGGGLVDSGSRCWTLRGEICHLAACPGWGRLIHPPSINSLILNRNKK